MKTKAVRIYGTNDLRLEEFELPIVNCKCIDLFQSVYAFPLVHMSGSMPRSCFFDYYTFVVGFEIESMISLGLFFLLRIDWLLAI